MRTGGRRVAAGLAAGLVPALAAARFIDAVLFEVAPLDPAVLGGAALVIVLDGPRAYRLRRAMI